MLRRWLTLAFGLTLSLTLGLAAGLTPGLAGPVLAAEQAISFAAHQQLDLPGKIAWPEGLQPEQVKDWVLLLHGSGALNMDADLAEASEGGKFNPFFKYLSEALVKQGFGVMRYDKRSYLITQRLKADTAYLKSEAVQSFSRQPVTFLIEDARAATQWLRTRYPAGRVHLLGHSEGTFIALQLARTQAAAISSLGLIGFFANSFDTAVFEQTIYRSLPLFTNLDLNHDRLLDAAELGVNQPLAMALRVQLPRLDLDKDSRLSHSEFQAAQFSNLLLRDLAGMAYRLDEAQYPRVAAILPELKLPVAFFVGEHDNQTPAYQTRAVAIANQAHWHNAFHFQYFPGLGHALDPRTDYQDLVYRPADPKALAVLAETFRNQLGKVSQSE